MKLSRIAIGGASGLMGLGLIGVGAHAAFTTTTTSHQTVSAGTLKMVLSATGASTNTQPTIRLAASPNNGSSFTTGTVTVHAYNKGTLTANNIRSTLSVTNGGGAATKALSSQAYVCLASVTGTVFYNGPLSAAPVSQPIAGSEPVGTTTTAYVINVYAGSEHTFCGSVTNYGGHAPTTGGTSTSSSLTNTAEGGSMTVTETIQYGA